MENTVPNPIHELLPHRAPFLFVDEILSAAMDRIIARHVFHPEEFFFPGHFPAYPVVPGVILIEALAQAGGAGLRKLGVLEENVLFFLASVDKVKFRRQVRPGEEVQLEIENLRVSAKILKQIGKAYVQGALAAEAQWLCMAAGGPSPDA